MTRVVSGTPFKGGMAHSLEWISFWHCTCPPYRSIRCHLLALYVTLPPSSFHFTKSHDRLVTTTAQIISQLVVGRISLTRQPNVFIPPYRPASQPPIQTVPLAMGISLQDQLSHQPDSQSVVPSQLPSWTLATDLSRINGLWVNHLLVPHRERGGCCCFFVQHLESLLFTFSLLGRVFFLLESAQSKLNPICQQNTICHN